MTEPLGKIAQAAFFIDVNHAGNIFTRCSHTGFLIYVMNVPTIWFSNNFNTVERSTFGYEFLAMRIARDIIVALCYKLLMFGVPLDVPYNMMCDNQGLS